MRSMCRLTVNFAAAALSGLCLRGSPILHELPPSSQERERERERERDCLDAEVGVGDAVVVGLSVPDARKDCRLSERRLRSTLPRNGSASGVFRWQLISRQQLSMLVAVVGSMPLQHSGEIELQVTGAGAAAVAAATAPTEVAERLRK